MHEYYDVEEYNKYLVVQAQAALFIIAYHGYLGVQSLWQAALAVVVVAWVTGEIVHVSTMMAGLIGLVLGVLCVMQMRIHHDRINYHQVFYFLVQPAVFYYTMPLYVEQTMFSVGIPLTFLLWLAMNMTMWAFVRHGRGYHMSVCIPVVTMFFFSWIIDKVAWVALGVTAGVTLVYTIIASQMRQRRKSIREK